VIHGSVIGLLLGGLAASAFFSGSETGFYRVTRVRLLLDALDGNLVSRGLLAMVNRPDLFVATTLIGNNLANYTLSLGIVLGTRAVIGGEAFWAELAAPILLSPVAFIYGELLPKSIFYYAPNRLLKLCGPVLLVFGLAFFPITLVLWGMGRVLQWLIGRSPEQVRLALARKELDRVFEEGHEAGVLLPAQRKLAQSLLSVGGTPAHKFARPLSRAYIAPSHAAPRDVWLAARRHRLAAVPVSDDARGGQLAGYVRTIEVMLAGDGPLPPLRPLVKIAPDETYIAALMRMRTAGESLAQVVDERGETTGLLVIEDLVEPLFARD
jgi:putative hemolysin